MKNSSKRIFITGIAGFIGFHLANFLKSRGDFVIGCDNFNDYYDPALKKRRAELLAEKNIEVIDCDINDQKTLETLVEKNAITHFVHLAAQAGIRHSITHPESYQRANLTGFFNILEVLRRHPHIPLTYASSSSVYGLNKKIPFSETDPTDQPANFYGATKKANEMMAHSYHHLYGMKITALRFFTVYGPWGRPDMAYYSFTKAVLEGKPIKLFNHGNMERDFTYIDDIVAGTSAAIDLESDYEIFNLGNHRPEKIGKMITAIEAFTGKKANVEMLPMQPGEIKTTYADNEKAKRLLNFEPKISLDEGMHHFLSWYVSELSLIV